MAIHARFPDLAHWKGQVKCQTACPVQTDAGRYVQLIADGHDKEAFLVARAPRGRVALRRVDACRRAPVNSCAEAVRDGTVRCRVRASGTQDELRPRHDGDRYIDQLPWGRICQPDLPQAEVAVIRCCPGLSAAPTWRCSPSGHVFERR